VTTTMQRITPFLWFDNNAEEAVNFYTSIFKGSKIKSVSRYGEAGPGPKGSVMVMNFELEGQEFMALNGGPQFKFTEAISLVVNCKNQEEVDDYWDKLSEGGQEAQCGWLKDKFGLSWQVVPTALGELMQDKDPAVRERVMKAMLQMVKMDIDGLKRAAKAKG
jgi:predicted 3-demethylubiquinone-9 3-methyltransferase (glyoxalase superfamily)